MNIDSFLKAQGISFSVIRNDNVIAHEIGMYNHEKSTSRKYIDFRPSTDILPGDWLKNTANEKLYVVDVQTGYFSGQPFDLKAYYQTEAEYNSTPPAQSVVFNIGNANGSVIGNNNILNINYNECLQELKETIENSDAPDKEELAKIISLLELALDDKVPVKKGLLSKFSDVISKHSWLASQLSALLINWLTSQ